MQKLKLLSFLLTVLLIPSLCSAATTSAATNYPLIGNNKGIYGYKASGAAMQVIGITTANYVSIDSGANGVVFGGQTSLGSFLGRPKGTTATTTATSNALITPTAAFQPIDTYSSSATADVINVATANIPLGAIVYFQTVNSSRDITFYETGNIYLGSSTRLLSDVNDVLALMKTGSNTWVEVGFYDNN